MHRRVWLAQARPLSPLPPARPVLPPRDSLRTARVLPAPDELGSPSPVIALFSSLSESPPFFPTSRSGKHGSSAPAVSPAALALFSFRIPNMDCAFT